MQTTFTDDPDDNTTFAPKSTAVAMEPCRHAGVWYYGQACVELAEVRIRERNRHLARHPVIGGNCREQTDFRCC